MANKARIAKLVRYRGKLPLHLNKAIAYSPGFSTVVSGILLEGTPYKDTVYLHHYIQPFFLPQDRIILSYSRRLQPASGNTEFFEGSDEKIADQCLQCLERSGLCGQLARPTHADGFIRLVEGGQVLGRDWRTEANLAAAHATLGDGNAATIRLGKARQDLHASMARRGPFPADAAARASLDALGAMLAAPADPAATIRQQALHHAAALGFMPASPAPSQVT